MKYLLLDRQARSQVPNPVLRPFKMVKVIHRDVLWLKFQLSVLGSMSFDLLGMSPPWLLPETSGITLRQVQRILALE